MNDPIERAGVFLKKARVTYSMPQAASMVISTPAILALQSLTVDCTKNTAPDPFSVLTWWIKMSIMTVVSWRGIIDGRIKWRRNIRRRPNWDIIIRQ
jgi:hypothetical protein